jgi:hypothetical protein
LHTVLSAHDDPFGSAVFAQPVTALHESLVQTLLSLQLSAAPAVQVPPWQVSAPLQTLPSLQAVPLSTGMWPQPKVGSQVSVVQTFESLQSRGLPAEQVPLWQVSVPLQALVSAHAVPFSTAVCVQPLAGLQESVVQTFPSLQLSAVPAVQTPAWHVSAPSQASPSLHEVPFSTGMVVQPKTVSQLSVVQGLPSLHVSGVPAVQVPA